MKPNEIIYSFTVANEIILAGTTFPISTTHLFKDITTDELTFFADVETNVATISSDFTFTMLDGSVNSSVTAFNVRRYFANSLSFYDNNRAMIEYIEQVTP